jgi:hypothetical protein
MENFIYLPDSSALVNLSLLSIATFSGSPNSPTCTLYFGCGIAPFKLTGGDIARLMEILRVDLQEVQFDLQRTHAEDFHDPDRNQD